MNVETGEIISSPPLTWKDFKERVESEAYVRLSEEEKNQLAKLPAAERPYYLNRAERRKKRRKKHG